MPEPHWELFFLADRLDMKTRSPCQRHQSISKANSNAKRTIPKNTTDTIANDARFLRSARLSISLLTITTSNNNIISIYADLLHQENQELYSAGQTGCWTIMVSQNGEKATR
jgi:hypothetical protein